MTLGFKSYITFANGERKVIDSKVHAFIASHPLIAVVVALIVGAVVGRLI